MSLARVFHDSTLFCESSLELPKVFTVVTKSVAVVSFSVCSIIVRISYKLPEWIMLRNPTLRALPAFEGAAGTDCGNFHHLHI